MKKGLFWTNFGVFIAVWLGFAGYALASIYNPKIILTPFIFWIFILILDSLAAPFLYLWWATGPKHILHKTEVLLSIIILSFYWGFSTLYSFLALDLNNFQLKWFYFAYIWEVIIIGIIAILTGLWIIKPAHNFLQNKKTKYPENILHQKLSQIPIKGAIAFVLFSFLGYVIGSIQLRIFSGVPLAEIVKNISTGITTGILSAIILFFIYERLIFPALKKSGELSKENSNSRPSRLSFYGKIYLILAVFTITSVLFLGTVLYGRGQHILESRLSNEINYKLSTIALNKGSYDLALDNKRVQDLFGKNGYFFILRRSNPTENYHLPAKYDFSKETLASFSSLAGDSSTLIDRNFDTKLIGIKKIDDFHELVSVSFLGDFNDELNLFLFYAVIVLLMIGFAVVTVGTLFSRSITIPIKEIRLGGIRIGKGDFSQPITVYTNDELEDLSHALNDAADNLEVSYTHLEDEISKRTKDLASANKTQKNQIEELNRTAELLRKREKELRNANEQLMELDKSKNQFISIAAHQLRTPLSALKWTIKSILDREIGPITASQETYLEAAYQSNQNMIKLVNDLLNVSKIESGRFTYHFESTNIIKIINEIMDFSAVNAKKKKVSLIFNEPREPIIAEIDNEKISMAIQNLIDNAIRYTDEGGKVTVALDEKEKKIIISVKDTGIGISQHDEIQLFQKFFRAERAIKMATEGTGLGLFIAREVVRGHGGDIDVKSREGEGSTFSITIPKKIHY